MNKIFIIFITVLFTLAGCSDFEKKLSYYERVSGISLPQDTEVIEYVDNGEFFTVAMVQIPADEIENFSKQYSFKKVEADVEVRFIGMNELKKEHQIFPANEFLAVVQGRTKTNTWYYLLDHKTGRIWMEIQYPDFSGTLP